MASKKVETKRERERTKLRWRCIITRIFLWHENEHLKVLAVCIEFNTNSKQQNGNDAANVCVVQLISFYLQILCHKYHKNCNRHSQRNEVEADADAD